MNKIARAAFAATCLMAALPLEASAGSVRASYYGAGERLAKHTANGERFNPRALTCAHRSYPLGTRLRVTYSGRSVICRVNDRGPAAWTGKSLDLTLGAARALGFRAGIVHISKV